MPIGRTNERDVKEILRKALRCVKGIKERKLGVEE